MLTDVEEILAELPPEIWSSVDSHSDEYDPGGSLLEIVSEHLKIGAVFATYAEKRIRPASAVFGESESAAGWLFEAVEARKSTLGERSPRNDG